MIPLGATAIDQSLITGLTWIGCGPHSLDFRILILQVLTWEVLNGSFGYWFDSQDRVIIKGQDLLPPPTSPWKSFSPRAHPPWCYVDRSPHQNYCLNLHSPKPPVCTRPHVFSHSNEKCKKKFLYCCKYSGCDSRGHGLRVAPVFGVLVKAEEKQ